MYFDQLSHIGTVSQKNKYRIAFVGIGELLCSISTIIFGYWAFQNDKNRFKNSNGIHIWSGGEGLICGLFCLGTSTTYKKYQMISSIFVQVVGLLLSFSVIGFVFKAILEEKDSFNSFATFYISLVVFATASLLFYSLGVSFTIKKYNFTEVEDTCFEIEDNPNAIDYYTEFLRENNTTSFYTLSNRSFMHPQILEEAPPPYSFEATSTTSILSFDMNINRFGAL